MKLIFTADTHFGSKFNNYSAQGTPYGGDERGARLIREFEKILLYAQSNGIDTVLLGGDLFDSPCTAPETQAAVRRVFDKYPTLKFYAVCGNHDPLYATKFYGDPPKNLYVFPDRITKAELDGVSVYGISLSDSFDAPDPWEGFHTDGRFITLCHGTISGKGGFSLNPRTLSDSGAALSLIGHIHKRSEYTLPSGRRALYSGTPAGRGFDECGEKSFFVIDTDDFSYTAVNTSAEIYIEYTFDISEAHGGADILEILSAVTPAENEVARAVLTGSMRAPFNIDCGAICSHTDGFVQVKDETKADIDYFKSIGENTLEGKFVSILAKKLENAAEGERETILDAIKEGVIAIRSGR